MLVFYNSFEWDQAQTKCVCGSFFIFLFLGFLLCSPPPPPSSSPSSSSSSSFVVVVVVVVVGWQYIMSGAGIVQSIVC